MITTEINGVDRGLQLIQRTDHGIILPSETVRALGLDEPPDQAVSIGPGSDIDVALDLAGTHLKLTVPVYRLAAQHFAPERPGPAMRLSPETWGGYVNYDVSVHKQIGGAKANPGFVGRQAAGFGWGGIADLRLLGPDIAGSFGAASGSNRTTGSGVVRLDSVVTWRPASRYIAVSVGDIASAVNPVLGQARSYRFGGVQVGTDFNGTPGWSSSPIPSVSGTAQAQSSIEVFLKGQRTFHLNTPGGPFQLVLPPGSTGLGTNVVVTDVTGRSVVLPVNVPRAEAQLLRRGLLLWSAGIGAPRFGYGTRQTSYAAQPYAHATARYGLTDQVTTTLHAEGGADLAEAELGASFALTPRLVTRASVSASRSERGFGGAGRLSVTVQGPWNLVLDATASRTAGPFDDTISVSGRAYAKSRKLAPFSSLSATSALSARLAWQSRSGLSISASYQANTYRGSPQVGFAALNAS